MAAAVEAAVAYAVETPVSTVGTAATVGWVVAGVAWRVVG